MTLLLIALIVVSSALLLFIGAFFRMSGNVGPLDLEDYARRNHVVFIPVAEKLVKELAEPSQPVRIRLDNHRHPLLAVLQILPPDHEDGFATERTS